MPDDLQNRAETVSEFPEILAMRAARVEPETIAHIRSAHHRGTRLYDEAVYDALRRVGASYRIEHRTRTPDHP